MVTMECRSLDGAIGSVASLLAMPPPELQRRLEQFDFDAHCARHAGTFPDFEDVLARNIAGFRCEDIRAPDETIWFHATRVRRTTAFREEGLLPLKECLLPLRAEVQNIVGELGIVSTGAGYTSSYLSKLGQLKIEGPCAFLLREAPLRGSRSDRKYLESPEIVEDIANELAPGRANEVLDAYRTRTAPCIVAFRAYEARTDVAVRALAYCYAALHASEDPFRWNTCFWGRGCAIAATDIVDVEWLTD
jgi:hypothetical protein